MTYTTLIKYPPGQIYGHQEDEDPLIPQGQFSTNRLSGMDREYRESSIGYISDSSEFLR